MVKKMKKILYTGSRSGISYYVVSKLKSMDYYLYLGVHTDLEQKYLKQKYKDYKNIEVFKLDITNAKDKEKIKNLDIDILINNAAIGEGGSLTEMDMDRVRNNFETNVFSSFEIVQIVFKNMMKKNSGKIIIMSSLASIIPLNFLGSYCGTKASISQMTRVLKNEVKLLTNNIKIVLIEPGMYYTGFNQVMLDNKYKEMILDSYFKSQIEIIRKKENILFNLLEKNSYASIGNKIIKAIKCDNPKFVYRAPLLQSIGAKIYSIFK